MADVDLICKRYGIIPSDVLKLDVKDFQFNLLIAQEGIEAENKAAKLQAKRT